jgi:hypothetical protein
MAEIRYPEFNGRRLSWADMQLFINGVTTPFAGFPVIGFMSINYGESDNGVIVHGTNRNALGQTVGQVTPGDVDIAMLKEEAQILLSALATSSGIPNARGYGSVFFSLVFIYAVNGETPLVRDELLGCRITSADDAHSSGGDALKTTLKIRCLEVRRNGASLAKDSTLGQRTLNNVLTGAIAAATS